MADLTQEDIDRLTGLVKDRNYTQFYLDLYRSGSTISGLYIPGPTGQGVFGNYSHQHVIDVVGEAYFTENRERISNAIASRLLAEIVSTRQGGTYRLLSDREFLAAEILVFTVDLGLPTEAYPGHDLIDLTGIDVSGATEGVMAYAALLGAVNAIGSDLTTYYEDIRTGEFYTLEEAVAAGAVIEDGYVVLDGLAMEVRNGAFKYKGVWFSSRDLIEIDGVLFVNSNLFSSDGEFELLPVGLTTVSVINAINKIYETGGGSYCFTAGTPVLLSDHSSKPIESIVAGDSVLSYDTNGALVPGHVTRAFQNEVSHLLDVHGLKVTPGHVTLCGDGRFTGRHVPIIDILLSDGALVKADGSLVRMAINAPVGSVADAFVKVAVAMTSEDVQNDTLVEGEMRIGTLLFDRDGTAVSVLDCVTAEGYDFDPEAGLVAKPGEAPHPLYWFGALPRPEDYILRRSRETLEGILTDAEWEGSPSALIDERLRQTTTRRMH